jgi:adenosylhomocysteine nucleosidase
LVARNFGKPNEAMIAVTFALPAESSAFLRRLRKKSRSNQNGIRIVRGEIVDCAIAVLHTGVGETICRRRMAIFLQNRQFKYLISAGFAGALSDRLHVGDLVVAENFSTLEQRDALAALSTLPIHDANLVTVPSMIDSAAERKRIAQTTDADAADMETESIARLCAEHALPLLSLRVISDTLRDPFPAPARVLFDIAKQRTNLKKFAAFFLTHPGRIPRLIQFARRIGQARKTLANAIVDIVQNL